MKNKNCLKWHEYEWPMYAIGELNKDGLNKGAFHFVTQINVQISIFITH